MLLFIVFIIISHLEVKIITSRNTEGVSTVGVR